MLVIEEPRTGSDSSLIPITIQNTLFYFVLGLLAGTNGTNSSYGSSLNALGLTLADLNSSQFAMPQSPPANSPLYFLNNNNNNSSRE